MNAVLQAAKPRKVEEPVHRWVGFELGGQNYALPIASVSEVLTDVTVEPIPGAPPGIVGVTNLRGRIVTVVDLHERLSVDHEGEPEQRCVVVVELDNESVALCVDRITQLHGIRESVVKPPPSVSVAGSDHAVTGVVHNTDGLLTLLDLHALLEF